MFVQCNNDARSYDHYCSGGGGGGGVLNIVWVCVFLPWLSSIKSASFLRRITWSSVACPAIPYFSTLSHTRHDLRRKLVNTKRVFWFSLQRLTDTFLIVRRIQRDIITYGYRSSCKVPVILARFQWNLYLLDRFSDNPKISISSRNGPTF
jgi:hypothetical protein